MDIRTESFDGLTIISGRTPTGRCEARVHDIEGHFFRIDRWFNGLYVTPFMAAMWQDRAAAIGEAQKWIVQCMLAN